MSDAVFKEMMLGGQFGFITTDVPSINQIQSLTKDYYVYILSNAKNAIHELILYSTPNQALTKDVHESVLTSAIGIAFFDQYPNSPTIRLTNIEMSLLMSDQGKQYLVNLDYLKTNIDSLFNVEINKKSSCDLFKDQEIEGKYFYIFDKALKLYLYKCIGVTHERYEPPKPRRTLMSFVIGEPKNYNIKDRYKILFANKDSYKTIVICVSYDGDVYVENGSCTDDYVFLTQLAAMDHLNEIKENYCAILDDCSRMIKEGYISDSVEKVLKALDELDNNE